MMASLMYHIYVHDVLSPSMCAVSKVKQSRKEKEAELAEVIAELSLKVEVKGSCRKPTWKDQPVVLLAMLPVHTAT